MVSPFYIYHLFKIFQNKIKNNYMNIDESPTSDLERSEEDKREESEIELKNKIDQYKRNP